MTRLSLLEDQKAILTVNKELLEEKRRDIYVREEQAISGTIYPFFSKFTPEVEIEITRGSIYFKMAHPDYSYKKELFNIYLRENWNFDGEKNNKSYDGIDLSYYTTSTKGINTWELKRLQLLGVVAEIVLEHQDRILHRVNNIVIPFKAEFAEVFKEMQDVGSEIRELDNKINTLKSEAILIKLSSEEGVVFDTPQNIELKRTYCPRLNRIRIIEVKGKTCTVEIEMGDSYKTTESRVNIESLVSQVKHYNVL
jgi:hypothetical protein